MGHKTHPLGFRLGIIKDWKAHWYSQGASGYSAQVKEDPGQGAKADASSTPPALLQVKKGASLSKRKDQPPPSGETSTTTCLVAEDVAKAATGA